MYTSKEKLCILLGEYGLSSKKFFQLVDSVSDFDNPIAVFNNATACEILGSLVNDVKSAFKKNAVDGILADMQANGVSVVTWFSARYPNSLRDINEPPYVLFCKGETALLNGRCLSVVGTRKASSYGRRVAADFTKILAEHFVIVSGLAYGIDSIAHETTLAEHGKTVAVLGSGILNVYPSSNERLADRIIETGGLVVSEYGLRAQPFTYRFPHRNRIVAGLSQGLLVCPAPLKSGTNSTVELALEQGKDIFAVPGEVYDAGFAGNNSLIKSMQGACVTTPRDIIDFYGLDCRAVAKTAVQLSFEEQRVVDALSEGPKTFDRLVTETSLTPSELNFLLANLELRSIIAKLPGNTYRLYGGIE